MTPEQVSAIEAIAHILEKMGTMPIFSLIVMIIVGPWVAMFFISRGQEKRFETVVKMYENNVKLVECYEEFSKNMQELVIYNSRTMGEVKTRIDNNLYCPIVRRKTQQKEIDGGEL